MTRATSTAPAPEISHLVRGIFILEQKDITPFRLPLFANGTPTLLFHTAKDQHSLTYLRLFGQTVTPAELLLDGDFTLIAYFLQPWCLPVLFGMAANELTDKPVDVELIAHHLVEKLLNAGSVRSVCAYLDKYLATLAAGRAPADTRVSYAAAQISAGPQKDSITRVQRDLYMTQRSFQRMFERNIGVSPNQFRRIVQFDKAFRQLNARGFRRLSDIAFENGYADQSHFNRTFREFTGQTAMEYLSSCPMD